MTELPWVAEMRAVFGLHEVRDRAALSAWLRSDGKALGDPAKLPWCGDAVDTAIARALPKEPRPGALGVNPYWALNWALFGIETKPVYGAVAAFKRPSGGHVGFLIGESAYHYRVLGGNQGNTISEVWIEKKRCRGTRWPSTFLNPKTPLPRISKKSAASANEA